MCRAALAAAPLPRRTFRLASPPPPHARQCCLPTARQRLPPFHHHTARLGHRRPAFRAPLHPRPSPPAACPPCTAALPTAAAALPPPPATPKKKRCPTTMPPPTTCCPPCHHRSCPPPAPPAPTYAACQGSATASAHLSAVTPPTSLFRKCPPLHRRWLVVLTVLLLPVSPFSAFARHHGAGVACPCCGVAAPASPPLPHCSRVAVGHCVVPHCAAAGPLSAVVALVISHRGCISCGGCCSPPIAAIRGFSSCRRQQLRVRTGSVRLPAPPAATAARRSARRGAPNHRSGCHGVVPAQSDR